MLPAGKEYIAGMVAFGADLEVTNLTTSREGGHGFHFPAADILV